jgi:hypothetical protein
VVQHSSVRQGGGVPSEGRRREEIAMTRVFDGGVNGEKFHRPAI